MSWRYKLLQKKRVANDFHQKPSQFSNRSKHAARTAKIAVYFPGRLFRDGSLKGNSHIVQNLSGIVKQKVQQDSETTIS
jgi:hypothetical protein